MSKANLFADYMARPGSKPLWQVAYESGAGSTEYLRQIGRGVRTAKPEVAWGIELSTGGVVTRAMLLPERYEEIWGAAPSVHERMAVVKSRPDEIHKQWSEHLKRQAER